MGPLKPQEFVKKYAFKRFFKPKSENDEEFKRFKKETEDEFKLMSQIKSPNIIKYYELQHDVTLYAKRGQQN